MEAEHVGMQHTIQRETPAFSDKQGKSKKRRIAWTEEQDQYLQHLAIKNNERDWRYVAEKMSKTFPETCFNSKKCRARWSTCLRPTLKKDCLTEVETLLILAYHHEMKNNWVAISAYFRSRHANFLRNNFHSILRKVLHSIRSQHLPSVGFSPSYFIQALYIAGLLVKIIGLSPTEADSREIVPAYMTLYVRSYNITAEKCEAYVSLLVTKFQTLYSSNAALQDLRREDFDSLTTRVVFDVLRAVKAATKHIHVLTQQQILDLIEQGYTRSEVVPFPSLSPHNSKDEEKSVESEQLQHSSPTPILYENTEKFNSNIEPIINNKNQTASPYWATSSPVVPNFSNSFLPSLKIALFINFLKHSNMTLLQAFSTYDLNQLFLI